MKKIINNVLWGLGILCFIGCGKKEVEKPVVVPPPSAIVGIGKVLPEGGLVMLSLDQPNKVIQIHKKVGDTIQKGDVLLALEATEERLQKDQTQATLQSARVNAEVSAFDIKNAEILLDELYQEFMTSKSLAEKGAETAQKRFLDSMAWAKQRVIVEQNKQKWKAQQAQVSEQKKKVDVANYNLRKQSFTSLQTGVLTRFDVSVGEVLGSNVTFGELAPLTPLVIEGEVDELYANDIREGQQVEIALVGRTEPLAKGVVSFVGAGLQNKSIIYETVGEASDRRVRRFTVTIVSSQKPLLINQKVECKIML